ncbi:hypothetical protein GCM10010988_39010 [Cnuibacter physcomitrellae]|uniref:Uncharacterized protein n=1 Tax=Cnuibacter physcomitrellae TaxID=1619308 RepID=A0A1X9LZR1_9MICO|nr:hypothetical protein [Cnuibacter physcomitrellae]ARJ07560.1 hypothetical protein B5808_19370 [Cnuibacter physcomitrellae]GGI42434.1 hypothetical protein GCM10010988_39010 [Cnuibacter physcomitrellae]
MAYSQGEAAGTYEPSNLAIRALDAALRIQQPAIENFIARARQRRPDATPAEVIKTLERMYRAALAGSGAAVGGVAALPAVGTGAALVVSGGEVFTTLEMTAVFALSLAEIHGVPIQELERRRTLVMGILLGGGTTETISRVAERTGQHWAKNIVAQIPASKLLQINRILGRNFITKYGTKQGILVLGRVIPFGIGTVIGGGANLAMSEVTIRTSRRAFGTPPAKWDKTM